MKLRIVESVTEPGAAVNEDSWGTNGEAVWVMDGATGVWPEQRLSERSDAAWFVEQCDHALTRLFRGDRDPRDVLGEVASSAAALARHLYAIDDAAPHALPSASFASARIVADRLQFTNLGDCITLWRSGSGPARRFGTSGVTALDEKLSARVQALLASGLSMEQARPQIMAMARQHRMLMNQPGGYWIMDFSGLGAAHAEVETVAEEGPLRLLLMSDGFSRLVDVYGRYDLDGLLAAACSRGLAELFEELREIEADDERCTTFPRNKVRDDATAVLLEAG
jgi:hypothetical protein